MSKEQIEEMAMTTLDILANDINQHCPDLKENYCGDTHCVACLAHALYNAGYRKQSVGEWIDADPNGHLYRFTCSLCGKTKLGIGTPYCPNCGARMSGGKNE